MCVCVSVCVWERERGGGGGGRKAEWFPFLVCLMKLSCWVCLESGKCCLLWLSDSGGNLLHHPYYLFNCRCQGWNSEPLVCKVDAQLLLRLLIAQYTVIHKYTKFQAQNFFNIILSTAMYSDSSLSVSNVIYNLKYKQMQLHRSRFVFSWERALSHPWVPCL